MEDHGVATEDQAILAWLQAEMESVAFQQYIAGEPANPVYLAQVLKAPRIKKGVSIYIGEGPSVSNWAYL